MNLKNMVFLQVLGVLNFDTNRITEKRTSFAFIYKMISCAVFLEMSLCHSTEAISAILSKDTLQYLECQLICRTILCSAL